MSTGVTPQDTEKGALRPSEHARLMAEHSTDPLMDSDRSGQVDDPTKENHAINDDPSSSNGLPRDDPKATAAPDVASASIPPKDSPGSTPRLPEPDQGFIHRIAPLFKLLRLYSRLEVEGVEHIPDGPAILVANHTGWLGLDYAYAALSVYDTKKRVVRGLAHKTWFRKAQIGDLAERLGLLEVAKDAMQRLVDSGELVMIFPEGERGAFKSERERYLLRPFARGYVRVAMATGVPVLPVAIVGGEEANPSTALIDSYEDLLDLSLPMPANFFPRPVKWRISILPPVHVPGGAAAASDRDEVHAWNDKIRAQVQEEVHRLISVRGNPFF